MNDVTGAFEGPHLPAHVYIHVPFCRLKCSYCDFYSVDDYGGDTVAAYLRGVESELHQFAAAGLPGVVETVYLGGGTPTVIGAGVIGIVRAALEHVPVRMGAEVTVEANPDSVTSELIEALAIAGTTRVSVGIQSFVKGELALLGRLHTVEEAGNAARAVRAAGLDLSVDLMCGIPGQTVASWVFSLEQALELDPGHVSVYPLSLEEGTPLSVAIDTGLVAQPDPDVAAEQMLVAEEVLASAGRPRYEVANYARPGAESRHNLAYWTGSSYVGIGPGAHGMLDAETARAFGLAFSSGTGEGGGAEIARVRYSNPSDVADWLTIGHVEAELLSPLAMRREDVMLGLRLVRGVSHSAVVDSGLGATLDELERDGLVERVTGSGRIVVEEGVVPSMRWRTTTRGWLLGNEVFSRVWPGP